MTETPHYRYDITSFEGPDHVGKGDAQNYLYGKLSELGVDVLTTSFPIYATPIGNTIREYLTNGKEKFALSTEEDLEIKMSLFALNRLEFLEAFLTEDIADESLILFDRSAFSNALTIAYGIKNNPDITDEEKESLVTTALELDSLLINKLNLKNCVIQLETGDEVWESSRGGGKDLHEIPEVQRLASEIYSIYQQFVKDGWKIVFTKSFDKDENKRKWRDREDIYIDIYRFLVERFGDFESKKGRGRRGEIGIKEVMKHVYIGSEVDENLLTEYTRSIRDNDKDTMYVTSVDVSKQINSSFKSISIKNKEIKVAFKDILARYPKINYVLECNLGEEYVASLLEGLNDE